MTFVNPAPANCPGVIITTNELPSVSADLSERMLPAVNVLINQMRGGEEDCVPDIIRESSEVIAAIAKELFNEVPGYVCSCSYDDLMGDKAIGKNAVKKIRQAWASDHRAFSVSKEENAVRHQPEGGKEIYWQLKAITDEIPFSLNDNIHGNTLTMDLDEACRFFQIDFTKRRFLDRLRR